MVLSTEWSQVEVIDLVNDGSGLGFGIVGGRSTGVVIKSILPGGIADRDGRLQSGDHILQINDVQTRGLASEHVATILRQCSTLEPVRMVVARPVDSTQCTALGSDAPIVPTKTLTDPDELETLLLQNGGYPSSVDVAADGDGDASSQISEQQLVILEHQHHQYQSKLVDQSYPPIVLTNNDYCQQQQQQNQDETNDSIGGLSSESPESETIEVLLEKNSYGLGITVAGYVWEREDLSGIFVKGISEGSAAHLSGQIHLNDRIVEVDEQSLRGVTNHEAVEMLRQTGHTVHLVLERYLRGPRYEHLLNALQADHPPLGGLGLGTINQHHHQNNHVSPPSPSVTTLSWFPADDTQDTTDNIIIEPEPESHTTIDSLTAFERDPDTVEVFVDPHFESGSITPDLDMVVQKRWNNLLGDENTEIVVAQLRKLRGLGISLEGTVDVEDGIELRPRHFIRSILPEGPVGRNGKLNTGDELLEVNGQKLLGRNHVDVVKILKELPETVRIVCARQSEQCSSSRGGAGGGAHRCRIINTAQDREGFAARNLLSGSLRTLLNVDNDNDANAPAPLAPDEQHSLNNTSSTATLADVSAVDDVLDVVDVIDESNGPIATPDNDNINVLIHQNGVDDDDDDSNVNQHENEHESTDDHHSDKELSEHLVNNGSNCNSLIESTKLNLNLNLNNIYDNNDDNNQQLTAANKQIETDTDTANELKHNTSCLMNKLNNEQQEEQFKDNKINEEEKEVEHEHEHCSPPKLTKMMADQQQQQQQQVQLTNDDDDDDDSDAVTYLAIWKQDIEWIELYKINNNKGLGFSILDYQDPLDPQGTVIVVRSLIHGGCAQLNGRLHPGDRLMYVNDICLKNVTLEYAVKALKSTPTGQPVRIGFSKPMPLIKQSTTTTTRFHNTTISSSTNLGDASTSLSIQDNYFIW